MWSPAGSHGGYSRIGRNTHRHRAVSSSLLLSKLPSTEGKKTVTMFTEEPRTNGAAATLYCEVRNSLEVTTSLRIQGMDLASEMVGNFHIGPRGQWHPGNIRVVYNARNHCHHHLASIFLFNRTLIVHYGLNAS